MFFWEEEAKKLIRTTPCKETPKIMLRGINHPVTQAILSLNWPGECNHIGQPGNRILFNLKQSFIFVPVLHSPLTSSHLISFYQINSLLGTNIIQQCVGFESQLSFISVHRCPKRTSNYSPHI